MTTDDLESLRKAMDLTQAELAKRLGIGLKTYSEMVNGGGDVPARYRLAAERVAMALAVERGDPMLAPESVRQDALSLANALVDNTLERRVAALEKKVDQLRHDASLKK